MGSPGACPELTPLKRMRRAARRVLGGHGFGKEFKHATGNGVGNAAINHNAWPRIHPLSEDVLEEGAVFSIEPAV